MRKIIHTIVIVTFIACLIIGIFYYKKLIVDDNWTIITDIKTNNQTTAILQNPNDFYNNISLPKYSTNIEEKSDNNNISQESIEIISDNIIKTNSWNTINNQKLNNNFKNTIEMTFLWDVMIWSRVWDAMDKKWQEYVYGWLTDYLSQKDWVVLNLETTVTTREEKINKSYTFKAKPEHLSWLKWFNDNLYVNLANNHIWDFTASWVVDTINYLDEYNIEYFWAGKNKSEADSIKIIEIQWVRLWLIWQTCVNPVSFWATDKKAGNSRFDKEVIINEIKYAHKNNVDIIVYNMHCWIEYTNGPNWEQIDFAHFAIDNGANLVIWHHPHWYQPLEIYKESFIFYSLWDTIFDIFRWRRTQEGIMANIIIENKKIIAAEIIPTYTQSYWNTIISNERMEKYVLNELYNISKKIWDIPEILEGKIFLQN